MRFRSYQLILFPLICLLFTACKDGQKGLTNNPNSRSENRDREDLPEKPTIKYSVMEMKDSGMKLFRRRYDIQGQATILALNRIDRDHVGKLDTLIVPDSIYSNFLLYSPFPFQVDELKDVEKIIFFSYPAQAFAAYEFGRLKKWGPTCMGRKSSPTPIGLFYTNWKAEETQSTVDDEWILKWNFNIENKEGIGFHQYAMPGYPASHSCLRLLESDARFLYDWADQWVLKGTDVVLANGTPCVVFGHYPFGKPKPWLSLIANPNALDITPAMMMAEIGNKKPQILSNQAKLKELNASKDTATAKL